MRLTLSSGSPWHCDYYNQYRQVLFKVAPLGRLPFGVYITISRVVPPRADGPRRALETIGGFYWDGSKETRIKYRGEDQHVKQFFREPGSFSSATQRAFFGPDGKEYVWKVYPKVCQLFLSDPSKTPVAVFKCKRKRGFFTQERPASVEIFPQGEHMVELILVTLLYVEKLRRDEKRSRWGGDRGGEVGDDGDGDDGDDDGDDGDDDGDGDGGDGGDGGVGGGDGGGGGGGGDGGGGGGGGDGGGGGGGGGGGY